MPKSLKKMQAVKDRIFQAAMELFEKNGYENTNVEEITKKAGVSKGTFFTHFSTKNDIYSAIGAIFIEYMQDIAETGMQNNCSSHQILKDCINMAADWCAKNKPMIKNVLTSGMYYPKTGSRSTNNRVAMTEILGRVIKAGQAQGEFSKYLLVEDASILITSMYLTIMYDWINDGCVWELESKLNNGLNLLYMGLRP